MTLSPSSRSSRPDWMRRAASLLLVLPAAVVGAGSGLATRFLRGTRQGAQPEQAQIVWATTCIRS